MLSDEQSRKIAKYRKLAKKNVFCKYLAAGMIISNVIVTKFFSFHRRRLTVLAQLCIVASVFLLNTSFAPPSYASADAAFMQESEYIKDHMDITIPKTPETDEEQVKADGDEHSLVDTEDVAGLDDLIGENGDDLTDAVERDSREKQENTVFDKNDWKLVLVNKQHTIPEDYEFTLGTIKGSMRCDERVIEPLTQMFSAAKSDGVNLVVCSPYRDVERQEYLFERKVKNYQSQGMSYMEAYKKASVAVTLPGASEHQIGLALDIISDTYATLDSGFAETDAGKWLAEHSWEYGFILRYPLGKEEITGIQFEPWHFRYVGRDAAEVITAQNITLEEFVENL